MKLLSESEMSVVKFLNHGKNKLVAQVQQGEGTYCGVFTVYEQIGITDAKIWRETADIMRLTAEDALIDAKRIMDDTLATFTIGQAA